MKGGERKWNEVKKKRRQQSRAKTRSCSVCKTACYLSGSAALHLSTQGKARCPQTTPAAHWRWCRPSRALPIPACHMTPRSPDRPTPQSASFLTCASRSLVNSWTVKMPNGSFPLATQFPPGCSIKIATFPFQIYQHCPLMMSKKWNGLYLRDDSVGIFLHSVHLQLPARHSGSTYWGVDKGTPASSQNHQDPVRHSQQSSEILFSLNFPLYYVALLQLIVFHLH